MQTLHLPIDGFDQATAVIFKGDADIFNSTAHVLVNPVNCVGSSGTLAGAFARRFPDMETSYVYWCRLELLEIGKPLLYRVPKRSQDILLFPTMFLPASPASLDDIRQGLNYLRRHYIDLGFSGKTIAIPKLGCGVGGLRWKDVAREIIHALEDTDMILELYGEAV